jgi:hypothetical protein
MRWADIMKATALAALAERAATAAPAATDTRSTWDPHEVWLSRARRSREVSAVAPSTSEAATQPKTGPTLRD